MTMHSNNFWANRIELDEIMYYMVTLRRLPPQTPKAVRIKERDASSAVAEPHPRPRGRRSR